MNRLLPVLVTVLALASAARADAATSVSISGEDFLVNGAPTYRGTEAEGLLLNSRMVNAIFDDENAATVSRWAYPDTGRWSAERNVSEFLAALPSYAANGLKAVSVSLQGGNPVSGCSCDASHDWITSAYTSTGELKAAWMSRLDRVLTAADQQGMVVILTLFYHGQDGRVADEAAVKRATDNVVDWLLAEGHRNVVIDIANEANHALTSHAILGSRVHELIARVQQRSGGQIPASTGFTGGFVPGNTVIAQSDFVILHGNGQTSTSLKAMVDTVRSRSAWAADPKPIVFTEDSTNVANLDAAVDKGASWGYHDKAGYQVVPVVNWGINTTAKKTFFARVAQYAGSTSAPHLTFTPGQLAVTADEGSPSVTRTATLAASAGAPAYALSDDAAWLSTSPATGTAPRTITLTLNPSGLAPGTYAATVRATASGYAEALLRVTLAVSDAGATDYGLRVSASPDRSGSLPLDGQTVRGDMFVFTAPDTDVDSVAFHVDDPDRTRPPVRTEGNAPFDLAGGDVSTASPYDSARLADGTHTVTAAVRRTNGSVEVVHAAFQVDNDMAALAFTPSVTSMSASQQSGAATQSVSLAGSDGGTRPYSLASDAAWLSASPSTGTAPATLVLRADPTGLAAGTYTGEITATSAGAAPATVTVSFTVTAPAPTASYADVVRGTPGLAGYWRLDEPAGATVAGDVLGRNHGAVQNGVVLGQAGALPDDAGNRAARFDGTDDQVRIGDDATLDHGDRFSLEAWVRRGATSSSRVYRVLSKGDGTYTFGFSNDYVALRKQGSVDVARSLSTLRDTSGWHHIVATKDGAAVRLYVDGADVTDPSTIPSPVPAFATTAEDLFIGRASNGSAAFPGTIDEVAVYDRPLTAAQVQAHYLASGR